MIPTRHVIRCFTLYRLYGLVSHLTNYAIRTGGQNTLGVRALMYYILP